MCNISKISRQNAEDGIRKTEVGIQKNYKIYVKG